MSINCYQELAKDRKLTTIKYPTKDDNSDWEYVITDKKDVKEVEKCIQTGKIKDMQTILFNTKQLILEKSRIRGKL
ncbi:hypothetical protein [Arcobacter aquimarinus]|uniref:hypothetical protein n=1 Tax=Arcobacter aquimarinus TaxID=1315211 RepID=UPI003BB14425